MLWGTRKKRAFRGRRAEVRMRRQRLVRTTFVGMCAVLLLTGIWYGTRHETVTITNVTVAGEKTLDPSVVEQRTQAVLEGTYALLIPKRFSYLYPEGAIAAAIERMPRVKQATVERTSRTDISVTLEEYLPHALWCAGSDTATSSPCLFVSSEGVAYREAPRLEGATFLRYVTEGRTPEVGAQFASAGYVQITEEFATAMRTNHNMHVSTVVETADGDVRYQVRGGGEFLVSRDANVQEVFEHLESLLGSADFAHIEPGNFAYIDLRFGNKVYVKERTFAQEKPLDDTAAVGASVEEPTDAAIASEEPVQAAAVIMADEEDATATTSTTTEEGD